MLSWQSRIIRLALQLIRAVSGGSGELDVKKARRDLDLESKLFKPLAPVELSALDVNGIHAEWIIPKGIQTDRTILYLHGGGFNSGSIISHRSLAGNVAIACKARALLIDYRLAPEHPFPDALEDAANAYEWLLAGGSAPANIIIAGDSAGGTLTLSLLIQLRDQGKPIPALAITLSPATDLTLSGETWDSNSKKDAMLDRRSIKACVDIYLRQADAHSPLASPLFADLRGLPPLLIQVGSDECLLSDATQFAVKAKQSGVPVTLEVWDGMQHVWQFEASFVPEGKQAIQNIGKFVDRTLINQSSTPIKALA